MCEIKVTSKRMEYEIMRQSNKSIYIKKSKLLEVRENKNIYSVVKININRCDYN